MNKNGTLSKSIFSRINIFTVSLLSLTLAGVSHAGVCDGLAAKRVGVSAVGTIFNIVPPSAATFYKDSGISSTPLTFYICPANDTFFPSDIGDGTGFAFTPTPESLAEQASNTCNLKSPVTQSNGCAYTVNYSPATSDTSPVIITLHAKLGGKDNQQAEANATVNIKPMPLQITASTPGSDGSVVQGLSYPFELILQNTDDININSGITISPVDNENYNLNMADNDCNTQGVPAKGKCTLKGNLVYKKLVPAGTGAEIPVTINFQPKDASTVLTAQTSIKLKQVTENTSVLSVTPVTTVGNYIFTDQPTAYTIDYEITNPTPYVITDITPDLDENSQITPAGSGFKSECNSPLAAANADGTNGGTCHIIFTFKAESSTESSKRTYNRPNKYDIKVHFKYKRQGVDQDFTNPVDADVYTYVFQKGAWNEIPGAGTRLQPLIMSKGYLLGGGAKGGVFVLGADGENNLVWRNIAPPSSSDEYPNNIQIPVPNTEVTGLTDGFNVLAVSFSTNNVPSIYPVWYYTGDDTFSKPQWKVVGRYGNNKPTNVTSLAIQKTINTVRIFAGASNGMYDSGSFQNADSSWGNEITGNNNRSVYVTSALTKRDGMYAFSQQDRDQWLYQGPGWKEKLEDQGSWQKVEQYQNYNRLAGAAKAINILNGIDDNDMLFMGGEGGINCKTGVSGKWQNAAEWDKANCSNYNYKYYAFANFTNASQMRTTYVASNNGIYQWLGSVYTTSNMNQGWTEFNTGLTDQKDMRALVDIPADSAITKMLFSGQYMPELMAAGTEDGRIFIYIPGQ